jgi:zinc protease
MKNEKVKINKWFAFCILHFAFLITGVAYAQETPPLPSPPRSFTLPKPVEKTLPNGLRVIVVQTKNVPLVTAQLLVKSGGEKDPKNLSGLADFTASLLTKGTKTRSATKIAEEIEFLGGSINAGAAWDFSNISVRVTSDKVDQALAVMSDVVKNPAFSQEEIDRYREQLIDDLSVRMKQPGTVASFVSNNLVFEENYKVNYDHPLPGTPESVQRIQGKDLAEFHRLFYVPENTVLVFTGDLVPAAAFSLAGKWFGLWKNLKKEKSVFMIGDTPPKKKPIEDGRKVQQILVVDMPDSGQAAVQFVKESFNRFDENFYKASVYNSILGGGYSSRLNQEVRIKRGLSYGAGSSFAMRNTGGIFRMSTQTKNESAGEVAELFVQELEKFGTSDIPQSELTPRKSVLTGDFGRDLATTGGLSGIVGELAVYGLPLSQINTYIQNINAVSANDIKALAKQRLKPIDGYLVIVGDYNKFAEDLKKRFDKTPIRVIPLDKLDLENENLEKK